MDLATKVELLRLEVERLLLENWQLKGALGYPVPGGIPEGEFKCGLCEARWNETKSETKSETKLVYVPGEQI